MMNFFLDAGPEFLDPATFAGAAFWAVVLGLLAWLIGEAVRLIVKRVLKKQDEYVDPPFVILLGQLARVGVWLYALTSYADLVPRLQDLDDPKTRLGAIFFGVVAGILAWMVGRALKLAIHRVLQKRGESVDQTAVRFLGQLSQVGVWVFAFVSVAYYIPQLRAMGGAWLTSVGLVSVVVGLAAQNTLGNLIAGVSLVLYRPFKIGDNLQVNSPAGLETGLVESINLGYTILRTGDERRLVIPNSLMASQTCINLSMSSQRAACVIVIMLKHDADIEKARKILLDAVAQNPKSLGSPACRISNLSRSGVTLTLTAWSATSAIAGDMKSDILETAKKQFDDAGIQLPRDYELDPPPPGKP